MTDPDPNPTERPLREFVGFIWIGDEPGIRLRIRAENAAQAKAEVEAEYGAGHVMSLWNPEDASEAR